MNLIAYFSRAGENYSGGMLKELEIGNTARVASIMHKFINADMFQIQMVEPYSEKYNECIDEAQKDQKDDFRPALISLPESIGKYDTIYLGYPNYWGTMPMAVFTFLEHFDFTGKKIRPFCTHEGSGFGSSLQDIKRVCPGAEIENGLAIHGSRIIPSEDEIKEWTKEE